MKKSEDVMQKIGSWSFIVGLVIAVFAGVIISDPKVVSWLVFTLGVLGLIVGFLNVTAKESTPFLVASIALLLSSSAFVDVLVKIPSQTAITVTITILGNIIVFVAPAALLVALRLIYALASSE